jgi:uncharacterized protein YecE (DUF72 family)
MKAKVTPPAGIIRIGIGGWSYAPWRKTFYPPDVPKTRELEYASRQLTAIEINSTFYRLQTPSVFARWRDTTPENFMFSLKAPRFVMQRRVLAEAGESVQRFLTSGVTELGARLGPILWQLAPNHAFDAADVSGFLQLLPPEAGGVRLRHVIEARHASFMQPQFIELLRKHRIASVYTDSEKYPSFSDITTDFIYARLMRSVATVDTGYLRPAIEQWTQRVLAWSQGDTPKDLPRVESQPVSTVTRDVFLYFINGAKERAPAAARTLISELSNVLPAAGLPKGRVHTTAASKRKTALAVDRVRPEK